MVISFTKPVLLLKVHAQPKLPTIVLMLITKEILHGSSKLGGFFSIQPTSQYDSKMKMYNGWLASHRICDRVISIVEQTKPKLASSEAFSQRLRGANPPGENFPRRELFATREKTAH